MKKILFVDNSLDEFMNFRGFIVDYFLRRGFQISLLVPEFKYSDVEEVKGVKIYTYTLPKGINIFGDFMLLFTLYSKYKQIDPNIIIHYTIKPNIYGSISAKLNKINSISVIPGLGSVFTKKKSILEKIVVKLYKIALRHPKKVWVLNKDDYTTLTQRGMVDCNKLSILPGEGIDTEKYKNDNKYIRNECFVFLFIGRIIQEKGVEVLVDAAKELANNTNKEFKVIFLGSRDAGLSSGSISQQDIDRWSKYSFIEFKGKVTDVKSYIEKSDCIVLPSFYGEGVPRSLMEGASMEKVLITTDNVGCREVVEEGYNGFLCKPKSAYDLALVMKNVLDLTENDLIKLGKNGRQKMKKEFNTELIINEYEEVVNKLL